MFNNYIKDEKIKIKPGDGYSAGSNISIEDNIIEAEGYTYDSAVYSIAEGNSGAIASGIGSHAEGNLTIASGDYSHAEGEYTITTNEAEHTEGKYNVSNVGTISSIGIGTSDTDRKNAFEVMDNGDMYVYSLGDYDGTNINTTNTNGESVPASIQEVLTNLSKSIENTKESILNTIYPVGSIYISTNDINPQSIFGGGWEQIKDRFLLSAGDTYVAGSTGGESSHKLTIDEMPSHNHTAHGIGIASTAVETNLALRSVDLSNHHTGDVLMRTANTGNNKEHNNMPPYLTVYIWERIS